MKRVILFFFLAAATAACKHPSPGILPGQSYFVFEDRLFLKEYTSDNMFVVRLDTLTQNPVDTVHHTLYTGGLSFFKDTLQAFQLYTNLTFSKEHLFEGKNVLQLYTSGGKKAQLEFRLITDHFVSTLQFSDVIFNKKKAAAVKSDDPGQDATIWILTQ